MYDTDKILTEMNLFARNFVKEQKIHAFTDLDRWKFWFRIFPKKFPWFWNKRNTPCGCFFVVNDPHGKEYVLLADHVISLNFNYADIVPFTNAVKSLMLNKPEWYWPFKISGSGGSLIFEYRAATDRMYSVENSPDLFTAREQVEEGIRYVMQELLRNQDVNLFRHWYDGMLTITKSNLIDLSCSAHPLADHTQYSGLRYFFVVGNDKHLVTKSKLYQCNFVPKDFSLEELFPTGYFGVGRLGFIVDKREPTYISFKLRVINERRYMNMTIRCKRRDTPRVLQ